MPSISWIKATAEAGDAASQFLLGFLLHHGLMVGKDSSAAREWYEQAANQGSGLSQYLLYELLWQEGAQEQGVGWLHKAAESGNPAAQAGLGSYYWGNDRAKTDHALAFKWMKSAADAGYCPAITSIALMYEEGVHVKPDPEQAIAYLRKGAESGDASCATMLGQRLLSDESSEVNIQEGLDWIRQAAKKGDAFAFTSLAQVYRFGLHGVPQDLKLAEVFDDLTMAALSELE